MSITFDSKFVYIMGISGAYTHEEAKEILAKLSEVVNAAQQPLAPDVCLGCGAIYNRPESTGCGLRGTPRGVAPAGKA